MVKKWKPVFYSLLLAVCLFGTSCLNVTEEYFFRKDGSGTVKITYDLSEFVAMLDMMSSMGGDSTEMPDMNELFESEEVVNALSNLAGISKVVNLSNKDQKVFGFSYEFANVDALNRSLNVTTAPDLGDQGMGMNKEGGKFEVTKKGITRTFPKMDMPEETSAEDLDMASAMMGEASYTVKYSFEKKVKKVKAPKAEIANQDANSVTIKNDFIKMMKDEQSMDVTIKVK